MAKAKAKKGKEKFPKSPQTEVPYGCINAQLKNLVVPIDQVVPDPANTRHHNEKNLQAIIGSLRCYGQQKPIVARKATGVVIAGNGTLEAARALGWDRIAVVFTDLDDLSAAGYSIADNRTAELAGWDFDALAKMVKELQEHKVDLGALGWEQQELDTLLEGMGGDGGEDGAEGEDEGGKSVEEGEEEGENATKEDGEHVVTFTTKEYEAVREGYLLYRASDSKATYGAFLSSLSLSWIEVLKDAEGEGAETDKGSEEAE